MTSELQQLDESGRSIAYRYREGTMPTIVFLSGYASDMEGSKAQALDRLAQQFGAAMLRFDYSGTGASGGDFENGTLKLWLEDALAVIDRVTSGPLILVGSSMGGWLALHVALLRGNRALALVGIAAAPDFTEWGFSDCQKATLDVYGRLEEDNPDGSAPTVFTRNFWQSGQEHQLLTDGIAIDCPVRLLHGELDQEVPLEIAFRLMRALRSVDVQLIVVKGGGHRLSQLNEIDAVLNTVATFLELKN